jgi:Rps23 Pro-64 3,4-dihydroxylase Tpa1-like proline 4-hydroxylase
MIGIRPLGADEAGQHRRGFQADGKVLITDFLESADAERFDAWLAAAENWTDMKGAGDASAGLRYRYESIPLFGADLTRDAAGPFRKLLTQLVASDAFIDYVSNVTGRRDVVRADGHVTRFRAGHHLDLHLDSTQPGEPRGVRRIAFVIGMTRRWHADWGGWTLFPADNGGFGSSVFPGHNQLLLFAVPRPHLVSAVSPDCPGSRYAVSGWLRSDA